MFGAGRQRHIDAIDVAVDAVFIRLSLVAHGLRHQTSTSMATSTTTPTMTPIVMWVFIGTSNGDSYSVSSIVPSVKLYEWERLTSLYAVELRVMTACLLCLSPRPVSSTCLFGLFPWPISSACLLGLSPLPVSSACLLTLRSQSRSLQAGLFVRFLFIFWGMKRGWQQATSSLWAI